MSNLKELKDELAIAIKINLPKREIEHLKTLIEKEQVKPERKNLLQRIWK